MCFSCPCVPLLLPLQSLYWLLCHQSAQPARLALLFSLAISTASSLHNKGTAGVAMAAAAALLFNDLSWEHLAVDKTSSIVETSSQTHHCKRLPRQDKHAILLPYWFMSSGYQPDTCRYLHNHRRFSRARQVEHLRTCAECDATARAVGHDNDKDLRKRILRAHN